MSWQLASFLVLVLALAAGFLWYEREKPAARVLSLVAALAALAVVGRLAFAAVPVTKPTTDIVLFAATPSAPRRVSPWARSRRSCRTSSSPRPVDRLADGGLGRRAGRRPARPRDARPRARPGPAGARLRPRGPGLRRLDGRVPVDAGRAPGSDSYLAVSASSLPYNPPTRSGTSCSAC